MTATSERGVLSDTFQDPARAQSAFDALMREARTSPDVDVAFLGSGGGYIVLVQAKTPSAYERARMLLQDSDTIDESNLNRLVGAARNAPVDAPASRRKVDVRARWVEAFLMLQDAGVVALSDLVALAMALQTGGPAQGPPARGRDQRARLLEAADAELRGVTQRLTDALRRQHPELFDRRGRLRRTTLSKRLRARLGGRQHLTGADLQALEDAADTETTRSVNAP